MTSRRHADVLSMHPLLPPMLQAEYRRLGYWEGLTLAEVVEERAGQHPLRAAILGPQPFTYAELWVRAQRLAGVLVQAGMQPGDFLVAVQSNSWQGIALSIAASIAGIALSPLSSRISPTLAINVVEQVSARGFAARGGLAAVTGVARGARTRARAPV